MRKGKTKLATTAAGCSDRRRALALRVSGQLSAVFGEIALEIAFGVNMMSL
jgi:hypothetical protein